MNKFQWIKDPVSDILKQTAAAQQCNSVGICEKVSLCGLYCGVYTIIPPTIIDSESATSPTL